MPQLLKHMRLRGRAKEGASVPIGGLDLGAEITEFGATSIQPQLPSGALPGGF